MSWPKAGVFFFILWLVQTTLLWRVWPFGASPLLLLCAAVCFVWLYDEYYGIAYALIFGLLIDLQAQNLFGIWALALFLACLPPLVLRRFFNHERIVPFLLTTLLSTLLCVVVVWGVNRMFGAPASFMLVLGALPELLVSHVIICLVLHLAFVRTIIKHRRDRRYVGGVM